MANSSDQTAGAKTASTRRPDATIVVMGPPASGKTTFVRLITGEGGIQTNGSQSAEAASISLSFYFGPDGRAVKIVKFPGFGDAGASMTDVELLGQFVAFLDTEYKLGRKISGIIYMHRISDDGLTSIVERNLKMLEKLCGTDALKNVTIATTMWDTISPALGAQREEKLKTNDKFKPLLDAGAQLARHDDGRVSAYSIMNRVLQNDPKPLLIQTEIADGTSVLETDAGDQLYSDINTLVDNKNQEIVKLRERIRTAIKAKDKTAQTTLTAQQSKLDGEVTRLRDDRAKLGEDLKPMRDKAEADEKVVDAAVEKRRAASIAEQKPGDPREKPNQVPQEETEQEKKPEGRDWQAEYEKVVAEKQRLEDQIEADKKDREIYNKHLLTWHTMVGKPYRIRNVKSGRLWQPAYTSEVQHVYCVADIPGMPVNNYTWNLLADGLYGQSTAAISSAYVQTVYVGKEGDLAATPTYFHFIPAGDRKNVYYICNDAETPRMGFFEGYQDKLSSIQLWKADFQLWELVPLYCKQFLHIHFETMQLMHQPLLSYFSDLPETFWYYFHHC